MVSPLSPCPPEILPYYPGEQEELSTPMEDAQLERAVRDVHVAVGAWQDSTDNTHVGFRVLYAMDHWITYCGKKSSIDETTAAGDLGGTHVR